MPPKNNRNRDSGNNKKLSLNDLKSIRDQLPPGEDTPTDLLPSEVLDLAVSPLQTLITEPFRKDSKGKEIADQVLKAAQNKEKECDQLYQQLCDRTELLADDTLTVHFSWRLRVGGTRGFRELILPVFHPIYGIPYVPSSSLKGFLRAWARRQGEATFKQLLGFIEGDDASLAAVQILDAYPTKPCLKIDIANPQWKWKDKTAVYGSVPHPLLSMENVTLKIGIARTSLGTVEQVATVKEWLKQAFRSEGLGSRVSAGYGQADKIDDQLVRPRPSQTRPYESEHPFEFWSQGIYGQDTGKPEFRPVAVRGVLRYWFRAVALGLYLPDVCKTLETELFGGIEPQPTEGSFRLIAKLDEEDEGTANKPHSGSGRLILQAKTENELVLLKALLKLAFHLGGVGRGARRPLHWNSGRLRGCFWQGTQADDCLAYSLEDWESFLQYLATAFNQLCPIPTPLQHSSEIVVTTNHPRPRKPQRKRQEVRTHDIFNNNARIYLIPSNNLNHPSQIKDWKNKGSQDTVLGSALSFFYKSGFKGDQTGSTQIRQDRKTNPYVGGNRGTPSFVWIQSNSLRKNDNAYQAVIVFGTDHPEREKFAEKLVRSTEHMEIKLEWLLDFAYREWDEQITKDIVNGKLEALAEEAIDEFGSGQCQEF